MAIWHLYPVDRWAIKRGGPWRTQGEKVMSQIVRAKDAGKARLLASHAHGEEGSEVWVDVEVTACELLEYSGGWEGVIMQDTEG